MNKLLPILAKTMVLEYQNQQNCPKSPKTPSFLSFHIPALWFAYGIYKHEQNLLFFDQWIGWRENIQETIQYVSPLNMGLSCKFSLNPNHRLECLKWPTRHLTTQRASPRASRGMDVYHLVGALFLESPCHVLFFFAVISYPIYWSYNWG